MAIEIFIIDFDGVIVDKKGVIVKEVVKKMQDLDKAGHGIIVFTSRSWHKYVATKKVLVDNDVPHSELVMGKPFGTRYVDDKNLYIEDFLKL